jgi:hypothetical protein
VISNTALTGKIVQRSAGNAWRSMTSQTGMRGLTALPGAARGHALGGSGDPVIGNSLRSFLT